MIPLKPLSLNQMYRVFRGRSIKSAQGREFEVAFNHFLAAYFDQARIFLEQFDESTHAIRARYKFYMPAKDVLTKDGRVNKRKLDTDNAVKMVQDQVFRFLNLDDGVVIGHEAEKIPSIAYWTEIVLEIVPIPKVVEEIKLPEWSMAEH